MKPSVSKVLQLIPPLSPTLHKGQAGRVGVLGGSVDYSGAPYYSAMSAMKLGADLAFVVSDARAAGTIQGYSPDLIVLPYLHPNEGSLEEDVKAVEGLFPRIHSLVVGPGLSRNAELLDRAAEAIKGARDRDMPVVIDADGLYLIQKRPELVKGNKRAVLTPNVMEFKRLCEAMGVDGQGKDGEDEWGTARRLSQAFGGVTIVQKGPSDLICNENHSFRADNEGGLKRCGGQGDVLSGILGATLAWGHHCMPSIRKEAKEGGKELPGLPLSPEEVTPMAAYLSCTLVRECSRRAFSQHGRSMQTSDMLEHIGESLVRMEQSKL
ncbi:Ribokinase-like protein [Piptocephalis cylindrospora]|uniref:ATP-dependent (S)-NAD(P)H-hydrate dehydratase n=1 Tax=Piptocephalis cylindrospora TaxID=1907219 RepID=A0A4P9Y1C3_9FUNG|nr:Ribokinase-like protein [Piptocephalis cylindrospora]|eukprot:RKP12636.1 Ribokinase-like protein [Piptocephalis cylindrospora]